MANTAGAIKAGRAWVELFADDSPLARGLKVAENKVKAWGQSLQKAGIGLLKAGIATDAVFGVGAKAFADFEQQMAMVSTMLDQPQEHMDRFRAGIKDMAIQFGEDTATLAKGLYDLLSASVAPGDALGVLNVSVRMARAGMTDTAVSTQTLINILNAFHVSAGQANDVADMLFKTIKRGVTTMPELAEHIGAVTASAHTAGISMDEMGAAIATMTRNGLKTDTAVTGLQNVLKEFLTPSNEGAAMARRFGLELNTTTLKTIGLAGALRKLEGASPEQIAKIFPDIRGLRGAFAVLGDMKGFAVDLDSMANKAGAANEAFGKMTGILSEAFGQIKQVGIAVFRELGDAIADSLKTTIRYGVMYGRLLVGWMKQHQDLLRWVDRVALGVIGLGVAALAASVGMKVLAPTIGLIRLAVSGLYLLITLPSAIAAAFTTFSAAIGSALAAVGGIIAPYVASLVSAGAAVFAFLITPLGMVVGAAAIAVGAVIYFTGAIGTMIGALSPVASSLASSLGNMFLRAGATIGDALNSIQTAFATLKAEAIDAWDGIATALAAGNIEAATAVVTSFIRLEWAKVSAFLVDIWYSFVTVAEQVADGIVAAFLKSVDFMVNAWNDFGAMTYAVFAHIGDIVAAVWSGVVAATVEVAKGMYNAFASVYNPIVSLLRGMIDVALNMLGGLSVAIGGTFTGLTEKVHQLKGTIDNAMGPVGTMETKGGIGEAFGAGFEKSARKKQSFDDLLAAGTAPRSNLAAGATNLAAGSADRHAAINEEQQKRVAALQEELASTVAKAKGATAAVGPGETVGNPPPGEGAKEGASKGVKEAQKAVEAKGGFSGSRAAGAFAFSDKMTKLEESSKETAKNTKKIAQHTEKGFVLT